MINLRINNVNLPSGVTLDEVDWQVATDLTFTTIVVESLGDTSNLTAITFPDELTEGVYYYTRARYKLSTGYSEWSNIFKFLAKDAAAINLTLVVPTTITPRPVLTNFPKQWHPPYRFKITPQALIVDSAAELVAMNYIIEDEYGNVAWASLDDEENLSEIKVTNYLPENRLYTLRASPRVTSNDVAEMSSMAFYISRDERISIDPIITWITMNTDATIQLETIEGLDTLYWVLYKDNVQVGSGNTTSDSFILSGTHFDEDTDYHLALKVVVNGEDYNLWTYSYFRPIDSNNESPVGTIPDTDLDESTGSNGFIYDLPASLGD